MALMKVSFFEHLLSASVVVGFLALSMARVSNVKHNKQQKDKFYRFRWYHLYNEDSLFLVYTYLSIGLMRLDREDLKTQQSMLLEKLRRRFGSWTNKEITEFYFDILKGYPKPDMASMFKWVNDKSNEREKIQILDVLADLAYHNDLVTPSEFKFLYQVASDLKISQDTIRSIIAIRQSRLDSRQQRSSRTTSHQSKASIIKRKLHVLGLNHAKNQEEIKLAYRKLAKTNHPDRFANKSKSEQDMAHERFIEIKTAYDYLMQHFE
jgi:DnaJ-domain-containing protein 1